MNRLARITVAACLALALAGPASAARPVETWSGQVASVHDGDTLSVWLRSGPRRGELARVRVHGADTPELAVRGRWVTQPRGPEAQALTEALTLGRGVTIQPAGRSFDRLVARVILPDGRDLAEVLVAGGLAWVDERYSRAPRLLRFQAEASFWGVGLWADATPTAPWTHRRQKRR